MFHLPPELIFDRLKEGYKKLIPESFTTSDELVKNNKIRKYPERDFYVNNFGMYAVENNDAILYFGGRDANPIFSNIDEAYKQLSEKDYYKISENDKKLIAESVNQNKTVRIKLSDLNLNIDNYKIGYFTFYNQNILFNKTQKTLIKKIYGIENHQKIKRFFSELDVSIVRIYTLNPKYVKKIAENGAIAMACKFDYPLSQFDSNFKITQGKEINHCADLLGIIKRDEITSVLAANLGFYLGY